MALATLLGPALGAGEIGAAAGGVDWLGLGSKVLGGAMAGKTSSARSDASMRNEVANDFSGWNVNFGAGDINSERDQAASGLGMWIVLGLAAVVAVKLLKK